MADTTVQAGGDLEIIVHEHAQMIQDLMKQQAKTEEASSYQIRDLQKQIIGLRKQRADNLQCYEEKTKDLQNQLAGKDARLEALESRVQQLIDDVRNSATAAATEVLDQFNKSPDPFLNVLLNKLEDKTEQIHKTVEDTKRYMGT
jgi:DNA anti-recombination protein RmuC